MPRRPESPARICPVPVWYTEGASLSELRYARALQRQLPALISESACAKRINTNPVKWVFPTKFAVLAAR